MPDTNTHVETQGKVITRSLGAARLRGRVTFMYAFLIAYDM